MVEISITQDHLHLEVKGLDKLWAFKSQLDIPIKHIRDVWHDPEAASGWWHGLKVTGTNLPGLFTAGTFYQQSGGTVFWDVHDPSNAIVIELHDDRFENVGRISDACRMPHKYRLCKV
jgi:Bacterial PH domain